MAYVLIDTDGYLEGLSLLFNWLGGYKAILEDDPEYLIDGTLEERSAFELVREQLSAAQQAELDQVDAFWRANAGAFNKAFAAAHFQRDRKTALSGLVTDARGKVPAVPADHWWWQPIEEK